MGGASRAETKIVALASEKCAVTGTVAVVAALLDKTIVNDSTTNCFGIARKRAAAGMIEIATGLLVTEAQAIALEMRTAASETETVIVTVAATKTTAETEAEIVPVTVIVTVTKVAVQDPSEGSLPVKLCLFGMPELAFDGVVLSVPVKPPSGKGSECSNYCARPGVPHLRLDNGIAHHPLATPKLVIYFFVHVFGLPDCGISRHKFPLYR